MSRNKQGLKAVRRERNLAHQTAMKERKRLRRQRAEMYRAKFERAES